MLVRAEPGARFNLLALHRLRPQRYPFLLESVAAHPLTGRYDILFAFPGEFVELRDGRLASTGSSTEGEDFFSALSGRFSEQRYDVYRRPQLPFSGGWFLFLGYEAAGTIEPRLRLPRSSFALPDALAVRCPAAIVLDRTTEVATLIAEEDPAQLAALHDDLMAVADLPPMAPLPAVQVSEDDPARFLDGVHRIHDYLRAGDCFQVNLSRAWRARFSEAPDAAALYESLRTANPAPFAGLMRWRDSHLLSSSPERLLAVDHTRIETRPIAGTCARLADPAEDEAARARFIGSLKERAEHVMLIDLERNDLGRVCVPSSIAVDDLMSIESYAHVHHLVSGVHGRLRDGIGPGEILRALFPGGTITGCPKVRAMEIIAELEQVGRGAYTGAMGYLSRCGRMDLNILIRSIILEGCEATLRAGAGIVSDSRAEAELEETRHKARGLLRALGVAA